MRPLSLVEDEFHGQYEYVTTCQGCGTITTRSESFPDLQLNIKETLQARYTCRVLLLHVNCSGPLAWTN